MSPQASFLCAMQTSGFSLEVIMHSRHIGAAFEERQRRHYTFPTAQQDVLRVLERGPMRSSRLAVALGVGAGRAEQTCAELIKTGQVKLDAEGFYELTETR